MLNETYEVNSVVESDYFSIAPFDGTVCSQIEYESRECVSIDSIDEESYNYESATSSSCSDKSEDAEDTSALDDGRFPTKLRKSNSGGTSVTYESSDSFEFSMSSVTDDGSILKKFKKLTTHEEEEEESVEDGAEQLRTNVQYIMVPNLCQEMRSKFFRKTNISSNTMILRPRNAVIGDIPTTRDDDFDSDSDSDVDSITGTLKRRPKRSIMHQRGRKDRRENVGLRKVQGRPIRRKSRIRRRKQKMQQQKFARNYHEGNSSCKTTERKNCAPNNISPSLVNNKCVVCNIYTRTHVAIPCMHFSFCENCASKMSESCFQKSCPVCEKECTSFSKLKF